MNFLLWLYILALASGSAQARILAAETTSSAPSSTQTISLVPTVAPSNATSSPAPSQDGNSTLSPAPTLTPSPTLTPVPTPDGNSTTSPIPTMTPTPYPTVSPYPTVTPVPTIEPNSTVPTIMPTIKPTIAPTSLPTAPSAAPTEAPAKKKHPSLWVILGKTIAWLFIIALALLLFGFIMSNRYRIYYYIRSAWFRFLRWEGTQWVYQKLRLDRVFGSSDTSASLNEIIFDNDLQEGLLLQST